MPDVLNASVLVASGVNFLVQGVQVGAYAARLAGVQTGRLATALSLFNLFMTAGRLAALFLTPALGSIADAAARAAAGAQLALVPHDVIAIVETKFRFIILSGTAGTVVGAFLLPIFLRLFVLGIASLERRRDMLSSLIRLAQPIVIANVIRSSRQPTIRHFWTFPISRVPARLLVANILITSVYSIGVVAAYLASDMTLASRTTATGLSGLINGVATIAFTFVLDPTSALMTDEAIRGERPVSDVKAVVLYLALTTIVGTLLSQVLLVPAAQMIAVASQMISR